jgi:hypothetical protein
MFFFSVDADVNYTWEDYQPSDKAVISLKVAYRTAHSLQPGGMPFCNRTITTIMCASSGGSTFDILPRITTGDIVARVLSDTVDLSFSYSTVGYSDSESLNFGTTTVDFAMHFQTLGSLDDVITYKYYNLSSELPRGTNEEQALLGAFAVYVPIFNRTLFYDPDVSLKLLFSIEDPPTSSGSSGSPDIQLLNTVMTAGVIAAIVIGCLAGLVAITVGAYFVFPYLKARHVQSEALTDAERFGPDNSDASGKARSENPSSSRWSSATPKPKVTK